MDNGAPVDPRGALDGLGVGDGPYADAADMMQRLAEAPAVTACWVRQLFRYYRGREPTQTDACELARLGKLYVDSGEDSLAVIEALFATKTFLERSEGPQ